MPSGAFCSPIVGSRATSHPMKPIAAARIARPQNVFMKIPIEGDKIRIKDGERVSEETCFESFADLGRAPYGRTMSVLTKSLYQFGRHYWLVSEDGHRLAALVQSIHVPKWSAFKRVTFSITIPSRSEAVAGSVTFA